MQIIFLNILLAASNIPTYVPYSQYQQSQPQLMSSFLSPVGPVSPNIQYHMAYYSSINPNVNMHGYTQPPCIQPNFVPTDNHQSSVEQVKPNQNSMIHSKFSLFI